jgi:Helix-turn-helix domain
VRTLDLLRAVRDLPRLPGLGATEKHVLGAIVLRCNDAGECWPSHTTIARDCWLTDRTVRESLRRLEAARLVTVRRRRVEGSAESDTNVYRVAFDEVRKHDPHVGNLVPEVVKDDPHVRNQDPEGGEAGSVQVGKHDPHGGEAGSDKEPIEETNGRNQGREPVSLTLDGVLDVPVADVPKRATKKRKSAPAVTPDVQAIFDAWAEARTVHHQTGSVLLSPERVAVIEKRLGEGFDPETLKRAVSGIWESSWHRGKNDRDRPFTDLTLALRDAAHIEQFAALASGGGNGNRASPAKPPPPDRKTEEPMEALVPAPAEFREAFRKLVGARTVQPKEPMQ